LGSDGEVSQINALVADRLSLSDGALQQSYARSGALVVGQRMSWARTYLRDAGLITQVRRGVWRLTAAGRKAASLTAEEIIVLIQSARNDAT
jgi:restriction system protein